ncbi:MULTISPECIES: ATP-binding protein [unclassified Streptomyces]|uniref:ATP-binding protein n=1 Tax=unclassified Streptomyces TaxID=2593676 RepID=UPI00331E1209
MAVQAAAEQARRVRPPEFYLDVPGSQLVATEVLMRVQDTIVEAVEAKAMSLVYGQAGLGKTFATRAALARLDPDLVLSLEFARSRPGPKDLREELFVQMRLGGKMPGTPTPFDRLLLASLPRRPYVIVCDEAQQYRRPCFEFVRNLWDNTGRDRPAVIFVGGREANDTLQSDPALASRICTRCEVLAMSEAEALKVVRAMHPVWEGAEEGLLAHVDRVHAGGSMREWARATHHVIKGLEQFQTGAVDLRVVDWALAQC